MALSQKHGILQFIRQTLVTGFFLLLPILVIWIIISRVWQSVETVIGKISDRLHIEMLPGISWVTMLTLLFLLLLFFIFGLLIRISHVRRFQDWMESQVTRFLPGYEYIKTIARQKLGMMDNFQQSCVFVRINSTWMPGLVIEDLPHDWAVVYIPLAPSLTSGTVHIVNKSAIRKTDRSLNDFFESMQRFGKRILTADDIAFITQNDFDTKRDYTGDNAKKETGEERS